MNKNDNNNQPPRAYSTSLRLSPLMHERLARIAERTNRSKTFYIQEAINLYLEELEKIAGIYRKKYMDREMKSLSILEGIGE